MVVRQKKQKQCLLEELEAGDSLIGVSLAKDSGLILSVRVGKHTDDFLRELVVSMARKTSSKIWYTDGWAGYKRVLPPEVLHIVGKENTQRLE